MSKVVLYIGGNGPKEKPDFGDDVIAILAADSGLNHAYAHGVRVDKVVGDLDSVDRFLLKDAKDAGVETIEFPSEKDETDLEIALAEAKKYAADSLIVVGGDGQRPDHFIGNLSVLSGEQTKKWNVKIHLQNSVAYVCRENQPLEIQATGMISLVSVGGLATGVNTNGLKWELKDAELSSDYATGVSNEFVGETATVTVASGNLIVFVGFESV